MKKLDSFIQGLCDNCNRYHASAGSSRCYPRHSACTCSAHPGTSARKVHDPSFSQTRAAQEQGSFNFMEVVKNEPG